MGKADEPSDDSGRDPVEELLESFLARWRRGERPGVDEFAASCPERADEIRALFPAAAEMERLKQAVEGDPGTVPLSSPRHGQTAGLGPTHPERLGDYRILRVIGEGGMGVVYEAEHESLRNQVALKVMHRRFRADRTYLKRFETEARSSARLHHTNIVTVFDYGEQDGICYYAMQYIAGFSLDRVIDDVRRRRAEQTAPETPRHDADGGGEPTEAAGDPLSAVTRGLRTGRFTTAASPTSGFDPTTTEPADGRLATSEGFRTTDEPPVPGPPAAGEHSTTHPLSGGSEIMYFREVARLGTQVADALDYAHRQNVIHRDIKPPNLLLDLQGNVWVADFGLAKLVEADGLSQSHDVVGTLRFMGPERFQGVTDLRSDIYALGATLYELLTLTPAFADRDQARLIHRIAEEAPTPPRRIDPRIPRDLETIVLRVLAKDPKDRCNTAGELRDELRRFLEGRPTRWRRVGPAESFRRWCKRNPVVATLSCLLAALLTFGAVGASVTSLRLSLALGESRQNLRSRDIAERVMVRQLFEARIAQARASRQSRRAGQRFATLDAVNEARGLLPRLNLPPAQLAQARLRLRNEAIAALALPDLRKVIEHTEWSGHQVDYDGRLERCAVFDGDTRSIDVYLVGDGKHLFRLNAPGDRTYPRFSRDGRWLMGWSESHALRVWDLRGAAPRVIVDEPARTGPRSLALSADEGRLALQTSSGSLVLIDLRTGERVTRPGDPTRIGPVSFHPDGRRMTLRSDRRDGRVGMILEEPGSPGSVESFFLPAGVNFDSQPAWSPDGRRLAVAGTDRNIYVWTAGRPEAAVLKGHLNRGINLAFSHRGDLLASNSWSQDLSLWDPRTGERLLMLGGAGNWTHPPRFSDDDRRLASGHEVFDVVPRREFRAFMDPNDGTVHGPGGARIRSQDGRLVASGWKSSIALFDLATGDLLANVPLGGDAMPVFDTRGDLLIYNVDGLVRWPVHARTDDSTAYEVGPPERLWDQGRWDVWVAASPDGRHIALANRFEGAFLLQPGPPRRVTPLHAVGDVRHVLVFSPDGRWLATAGFDTSPLQVWEVATGRLVHVRETGGVTNAQFDPLGQRLWFKENKGGSLTIAVGTWVDPRPSEVRAWSPDGRMGLGLEPRAQSLRDADGRELGRLEDPSNERISYAFTPDGTHLLGSCLDQPALFAWDLRLLRQSMKDLGLDWDAPPLPAAPVTDPATPPTPLTVRVIGVGRLVEAENLLRDAYKLHQSGKEAEAVRTYDRLLALDPNRHRALNQLSWILATGPAGLRDPARAVTLAKKSLDLMPDEAIYLNTLGVAQYRARRFKEAVATLERSLEVAKGEYPAHDLFFLAMARYELGQTARARHDFDRAVRWCREHPGLPPQDVAELDSFMAEAQALLNGPPIDLPADVFAPVSPSRP